MQRCAGHARASLTIPDSLITMEKHPISPNGLLKHSQEFFAAADLILNKADVVSLPAYFLLGRSIELSLKAFLLASGMKMSELRSKKYGHNLLALLEKAKAENISGVVEIEEIEHGIVQILSFDYMEKRLEYRTEGTYYLPYIDVTWRIARKLAFELDAVCKGESGV